MTIRAVRSKTKSWHVLAALVAVSAALRLAAGLRVPSPWIAPDEMIYAALGRSLYRSGSLEILGEPTSFYSLVYPALAGGPLALGNVGLGYELLKVLQAVLMGLAAVPVFLWARRLVRERYALVAAALTLAVPGLAYTGLVMTEVAFYPLVVLAAWATARALVAPTPRNQALLVGAILLAVLTRLQALGLVPALATAALLYHVFGRRPRGVLRLWPAFGSIALLAAAWAGWRLGSGDSLLGAYRVAGETSYDASAALRFVAYHVGDLVLLTAVFPACAVGVLAVDAARGRERSDGARAYLAIAVSLFAWLVVEVGVFASRHVGQLAERDLLGLAPVLFVGFALWLDRGAPRPYLRTSLVALGLLAFVVTLPVSRLLTPAALPDAFTLIPLYRLLGDASSNAQQLAVYAGAGLAVLAFVLLPRRLAAVFPVLSLAALVAASAVASDYVADQARTQKVRFFGDRTDWVDAVAGRGVAYVYDGEPNWNAVWATLFWNRRIDRVYDLPGAHVPGPLPQAVVEARPDGALAGKDGNTVADQLVVASTDFAFVGTQLVEHRQYDLDQLGLRLWRVDPPARLSTEAAGLRPNGDVESSAQLDVYDCELGAFRLTIVPKVGRFVQLLVNGKVQRRLDLAGRGSWSGVLYPPPEASGGTVCTFGVETDGLIGTTVFRFERF